MKDTIRTSLLATASELSRLLRDPALALWALYIVTFPIYVFASGLPQPGDWVLVPLAFTALSRWNGRLSEASAPSWRSLLIFTGYVITINVIWTLALGAWALSLKSGFGMSPVFYIYNALVFLVVLVLHKHHGDRLLYVTAKLILITLLMQVLVALLRGGAGRATVLFNNPNQLGYYALLSASILVVLQRYKLVSSIEVTIGMLASTYLSLLSASKAALAGIVLLSIAGMFSRLRTMLLVGLAFGILLLVADPMIDALSGAISRIETDDSHAFAEERGYDRIIQYPEYWVLGSGEGAYERFKENTVIGSHEIHSSIGTLFFCYGIVGTLLFVMFSLSVLRRTGLRTWLLVAPSFAYGMTHQGLRFTLFWVLLGLVVALRDRARPR